MSTEHAPLTSETNNEVYLTSFHGGAVRGRCLQLTQINEKILPAWTDEGHRPQAVALNREQAEQLRDALDQWLVNDLGGDPGGALEGR